MAPLRSVTAAAFAAMVGLPAAVASDVNGTTGSTGHLRGSAGPIQAEASRWQRDRSGQCVSNGGACGSRGSITAQCCDGLQCAQGVYLPNRMTCVAGSRPQPDPTPYPNPYPPKPDPTPYPNPYPPKTSPNPYPNPGSSSGEVQILKGDDSNLHRGACLSVDNNVFQNGQRLQAYSCSASSGQMFEYSSQDLTLRLSADPRYCVVTDNNLKTVGAQVQLWKCDEAGSGKMWYPGTLGLLQVNKFSGPQMGVKGDDYNLNPAVLVDTGDVLPFAL